MNSEIINTFNTIRSIYDGFNSMKRIKNVYYKQDFINQYEIFLSPFMNYDRKFLVFLALTVIVNYGESNFIEFLKRMNKIKKERDTYYKFKDILKSPKKYIKKDIDYILQNIVEVNKQEIFRLYQLEKISFFTFYFLIEDYKNELNLTEKIIYKRIKYLFFFIKYNIDKNIFNILLKKKTNKSIF